MNYLDTVGTFKDLWDLDQLGPLEYHCYKGRKDYEKIINNKALFWLTFWGTSSSFKIPYPTKEVVAKLKARLEVIREVFAENFSQKKNFTLYNHGDDYLKEQPDASFRVSKEYCSSGFYSRLEKFCKKLGVSISHSYVTSYLPHPGTERFIPTGVNKYDFRWQKNFRYYQVPPLALAANPIIPSPEFYTNYRQEKNFCDLELHCRDGAFKVHRSVLCHFGGSLLRDVLMDPKSCDVLGIDASKQSTKAMVDFIYLGGNEFVNRATQDSDLVEIFKLAKWYDLPDLAKGAFNLMTVTFRAEHLPLIETLMDETEVLSKDFIRLHEHIHKFYVTLTYA